MFCDNEQMDIKHENLMNSLCSNMHTFTHTFDKSTSTATHGSMLVVSECSSIHSQIDILFTRKTSMSIVSQFEFIFMFIYVFISMLVSVLMIVQLCNYAIMQLCNHGFVILLSASMF
jgi:hypothetical protein